MAGWLISDQTPGRTQGLVRDPSLDWFVQPIQPSQSDDDVDTSDQPSPTGHLPDPATLTGRAKQPTPGPGAGIVGSGYDLSGIEKQADVDRVRAALAAMKARTAEGSYTPPVDQKPTSIPPGATPAPDAVMVNPASRGAVVKFWTEQGVPDHVAQGIADSVGRESGFKPTAWNPDDKGSPSGGFYQHHADRLLRLQQFAQAQGKNWQDPQVQNEFALKEVTGGDPLATKHWNEIKNAPDRATAQTLWDRYFERGVVVGPAMKQFWNTPLASMSPEMRAAFQGQQQVAQQTAAQYQDLYNQYKTAAEATPPGSKERDEAIADMRRTSHQMMDMYKQMMLHPPTEKPVDAWSNFGSVAVIAAMLGSRFAKQHLTAALGAAGDAMIAINANNHRQYEAAYKTWQQQASMGLDMIKMENDDIKELINDKKMAVDEKLTKLQTMQTEMGMAKTLGDIQRGPYDTAIDLIEKRDVAANNLKNMFGDLQKTEAARLAAQDVANDPSLNFNTQMLKHWNELQQQAKPSAAKDTNIAVSDPTGKIIWQGAAHKNPDGKYVKAGTDEPVPEGTIQISSSRAPSSVNYTESDIDYWARVLKNGGHLPPGLSRTAAGSEFVQKIMKRMGERGDPGDFIANVATVKADDRSLSNMTKMADAATSFERTASRNFDLALKLSKDAIPTDWGPWLNRWIETGETQFGGTDVPPYVTAMLTAANEYAKIMSGSTGAQGSTVDSRKEAAELFSPYLSKGQIDRVIAVAKADMANRKQSLYGQIDDIKARLKTAGSGQPTETQGQPTAAVPTSATGTLPEGIPTGSIKIGTHGGNDVYQAPDGKRYEVQP